MKLFILVVVLMISVSYIYYLYRHSKHIIPPHLKNCPVSFNQTELVECEINDNCNNCLQTPRLCISVNDNNPYTFEKNASIVKIPDGKWCLPPHAKTLQCNKFSGDPVLSQQGKDFVWRCQCKYPKLVRNAGPFGDCSEIVACGKLEQPKNNLVCPPNSIACNPGESWNLNPNWDPSAGICRCQTGEKFIQQGETKLCVKDTCSPGKTVNNTCKCPEKKNKNGSDWISYINQDKQCKQDPCNPHGYFDGTKCICNKGSISFQDDTSPIGWICKSPCDKGNNPCGNRGTCIFDENGIATCTKCTYPNYQSKDKMCNNKVKPSGSKCENSFECETGWCSTFCAPIFTFQKRCCESV